MAADDQQTDRQTNVRVKRSTVEGGLYVDGGTNRVARNSEEQPGAIQAQEREQTRTRNQQTRQFLLTYDAPKKDIFNINPHRIKKIRCLR